jgi:hypothetical protein
LRAQCPSCLSLAPTSYLALPSRCLAAFIVGPLGLGSPRVRAGRIAAPRPAVLCVTPLNTCPALRPRWNPLRSPWRGEDCCLPVTGHSRLSVRLPGLILRSTTIHFSELNDAACVLASPLLRTPLLRDRPSVRLPTGWLVFGRVGLDRFRHLTHWVTMTGFTGYPARSPCPGFISAQAAHG